MGMQADSREMTAGPMPNRSWGVSLAWAAVSLLGALVTLAALAWPIGRLEETTAWPHTISLGIWAFAWVLTSGLVALAAARLTLGQWLQVRTLAWLVLLLGAIVSAAQLAVLSDWAMGRF